MLFTFRMREGLSSSPLRRPSKSTSNDDKDKEKGSNIRRRHTCAAVEVPRFERMNLIAQKLRSAEENQKKAGV